jgi:hypothetical protein
MNTQSSWTLRPVDWYMDISEKRASPFSPSSSPRKEVRLLGLPDPGSPNEFRKYLPVATVLQVRTRESAFKASVTGHTLECLHNKEQTRICTELPLTNLVIS